MYKAAVNFHDFTHRCTAEAFSQWCLEKTDIITHLWRASKLTTFPPVCWKHLAGRDTVKQWASGRKKRLTVTFSCLYLLSLPGRTIDNYAQIPSGLKSFFLSPYSLTFRLFFDFFSSACQHCQVPWHQQSYPLSHPPSLCPVPLQWQ